MSRTGEVICILLVVLTVVMISIVGLLGDNIVNPGDDVKQGYKWHFHLP